MAPDDVIRGRNSQPKVDIFDVFFLLFSSYDYRLSIYQIKIGVDWGLNIPFKVTNFHMGHISLSNMAAIFLAGWGYDAPHSGNKIKTSVIFVTIM